MKLIRPRRLRISPEVRKLVQENHINHNDLVMPLFVQEGSHLRIPILSMPGIFRFSLDTLLEECFSLKKIGVGAIALFPMIDAKLKNSNATEATNPNGLYPKAISLIKKEIPDLVVITDVALDPYNSDGHDGLVSPSTGKILNDATLPILLEMALLQARAGADFIAPSDMMDGRISFIRKGLDENSFEDVGIISYTAKYASALYGPFREALDSAPNPNSDKKTYQMNPANGKEALLEARLDIEEGADILLVKPGFFYLDILKSLKEISPLPLAIYNVSGEYALLKNGYKESKLDYQKCVMEMMTSFKRAGADLIFTYHAKEVATWLCGTSF